MQSKLTPNTLTDAATIDVDFNVSQNHEVTLGGNRTFTFSNGQAGSVYTLKLVQDGSGSRTVTWPATVKWVSAAPTLSTGAADIDLIRFQFDGTNYFGETIGLNFV